jgi:hypothetical protein
VLPAIPLAWKAAGVAILLLMLGALGVGLYVKGRSDGAAACEAAVAQAVAKQAADDKALSDKLLSTQKTVLDKLHAQSTTAQQKVANAPITDTCGPVERDASRSVRALVRGGAAAP